MIFYDDYLNKNERIFHFYSYSTSETALPYFPVRESLKMNKKT